MVLPVELQCACMISVSGNNKKELLLPLPPPVSKRIQAQRRGFVLGLRTDKHSNQVRVVGIFENIDLVRLQTIVVQPISASTSTA